MKTILSAIIAMAIVSVASIGSVAVAALGLAGFLMLSVVFGKLLFAIFKAWGWL